jgi:PBP superfamily domain
MFTSRHGSTARLAADVGPDLGSASITAQSSPSIPGCSGVRFWERNGSGGALSGAVRSGHRAWPDLSDLQVRPATAALPGCALSSHRGGQGFKSPQLHRVLPGQMACSSFWFSTWEPLREPSRRLPVWLGLGLRAAATAKTASTSITGATAGTAPFTRPACPTRRCAPPLRWPALGMTVEELFGRDDAVLPVAAMPVAPLDRALADAGIEGSQLPGYDTRADGHLQVAAAIAAGLADAGSRASRPRLPMTWPSSRWPPNVSTSSSRRGTSAPARCRGS